MTTKIQIRAAAIAIYNASCEDDELGTVLPFDRLPPTTQSLYVRMAKAADAALWKKKPMRR